jgi:membrane protein implicated in regulation of membrane protease activity
MNVELWLVWVVLGFVLVIAELLTGTFYLLVIGIGAFAAAAVAWIGGNELVQAIVGGAVALAGTWYVHRFKHPGRSDLNREDNFLDRGQPVVLEGWANEAAGLARVRYRGTSWDARIAAPEARPAPGSTLYIASQEGNTLVLVAAPPAR